MQSAESALRGGAERSARAVATRTWALALLSHVASARAPTGAERSLALLAGGLSRRGHRVSVIVPGPWSLAPALGSERVEVSVVPARACWLTYHEPRPWPVALARWLRWAWPGNARARLTRRLAQLAPDVVLVNCMPHLHGAAAGRALGRPVVWHLREILPPGPRRRWLASRLARDATRIVAVSEAVAQWVREEGLGDRLEVVPNGVVPCAAPPEPRAARRALGLPEHGVLCGLYGQLVPHKGVLDFVEAARGAFERAPGASFVIAGPGPAGYRRTIERAVRSTRSPGRFYLLPEQPDTGALLAASDLVCLATRTPDPFPRAVLEAMAAGRPVAAYDSGGTREMVLDGVTGLLVPAGDVAALGEALVQLATDAALCEAMGRAALQRARDHFSLERHLDRMEAVFRGVLA
jgi:glycosyltransferase involved in cell wall biosynthesis